MFQIPWDYNLYSNWFNVRIVTQDTKLSYDLYEDMRYNGPVKNELKREQLNYRIYGRMFDSPKTSLKIVISDPK